jgi:TetR/AcrR family transcriptional regulator, transcriptional repressor for nem operon
MITVMRYGRHHKEEVRGRIVASTAALLRQKGLDAVAIPKLMKEVGLTHGGFYAHFKNRDELIAEAVLHAGNETANGMFARASDVEELVRGYLSKEHLDTPQGGCVVAALGTEGAKQRTAVARAFNQVAEGLLRLVDARLTSGTRATKEEETLSDEAIRITSLIVGSLVLGRLVKEKTLRARILQVARAAALA